MIPTAWVLLDALPRTPNGKVDLNALPDPHFDRAAQAGELVAARTASERQLVEIWREILDVEEIGIHDNFFALGGHSLLAVRLFAQIEEKLGVPLPLASLFQSATIAELASMVDEESGQRTSGLGRRSSRCDRRASDLHSSWSTRSTAC